MHLKGIQGNHMVTITWVRMMQCNAIKEKDMTGKHLSNHNKQGSHEKRFEAYFSLKCFLQKALLEKPINIINQERLTIDFI